MRRQIAGAPHHTLSQYRAATGRQRSSLRYLKRPSQSVAAYTTRVPKHRVAAYAIPIPKPHTLSPYRPFTRYPRSNQPTLSPYLTSRRALTVATVGEYQCHVTGALPPSTSSAPSPSHSSPARSLRRVTSLFAKRQ
eukprot:3847921-Rhodomonas_salina.1